MNKKILDYDCGCRGRKKEFMYDQLELYHNIPGERLSIETGL